MCILLIEFYANLHTKNIFHGDIKPDNLFVVNDYKITSSCRIIILIHQDKDPDEPIYYCWRYTPGFASTEHIIDIVN